MNIQKGQKLKMNDGGIFVITTIKASPKGKSVKVYLKKVDAHKVRYPVSLGRLKELINLNLISLV